MGAMIDYSFHPSPWWLLGIGLVLAAIVLASYLGAKGRSSRAVRLTLTGVRWITVALLLYFLLDPQWVEAIKRQPKSRVAVLLDTSRSMATKDLPDGARLDAAKHWIQHDLIAGVPAGFAVECYSFNDSLERLASIDAARTSGTNTALADALQTLLAVPGDDPLTAVVVCSDGIENQRNDPASLARIYRRKGIPIHTLTTGVTNEAQDIVLENVQVKRAAPNQAPTKVTVSLRASGYAQQTVPVQLLHNDEVVAVRDVRLTGEDQKLEMEFTPREKGFQIYEARIPAQNGEWLTSNNQRLFGLEVIDPTIHVLYMEGTPQQPTSTLPEWKYLKSALESDPNIKVKVLYREFGASGKRLDTIDTDPETGERIYPVEHRTMGFPKALAGLLEYDVVIHSDIRKESFSPEQLQNMARLVEEFGGGFIMIGGNSAFGKGGYHRTILDRIIPVAMQQDQDSQARPFHIAVPTPVWSHPLVALGRTRAETEGIWTHKFPLLYGCNVVDRAKPGATILGYDPASTGGNGARLILAVQNIGRGRSMAFTSDTTRTWGKDFETLWGEKINPSAPLTEANCDSRYYRQFWANAVRWLAAARIGRTNNAVSLELAQSYARPGEAVDAVVKVRDKDLHETATADVSLVTVLNGKTNLLGKATYDSATRSYQAQVRLAQPARAVVSAVATLKGVSLGDDRQLLVCEALDAEAADLRARPELMRDLARISGGKAVSISEPDPSFVRSVFYNAPPVTIDYRRTPIWDRAWWLCALLGLLTTEWTVRRLKGLA
jgi:uncharacterized membrane protein